MTLVFYELGEYEYAEIGRVSNGEIVSGEDILSSIGVDQFVNNEKRLLNVYDGPHYVAGMASESSPTVKSKRSQKKSVEAIFKSWIPYEGNQGGEGWQNTITGEVRYVENKPGAAGSEDSDVTVPANSTISTVSAAISSVLSATVMQSLKQQATGGGGSINPQMYVTAAAMFIAQTGKGSLGELQEALDEEAESEPEDAEDKIITTESGDIRTTTQTGVTDVTSAITQVSGEETVARLGMGMSDEEKERSEAWVKEYGDRITEEAREEFQGALDERVQERTISTDKYRGGVVVPNDIEISEAQEAMENTLDESTAQFVNALVRDNGSVDESNAETWVLATLTQIGDDSEELAQYQEQFDVSVTEGDGEEASEEDESEESGTITMTGGGQSIEMPTDTTAEDARMAVEDTLGQEFLKHTAGMMADNNRDMEDPSMWVMTGLTLSQIANPEGFETTVSEMQDTLIENNEEKPGGENDGQTRSKEVIREHNPEGDWQSFTDPVTDLLQEGESAGDIVQNLKETAQVGGHSLQDEQIRTLAFQAHKEATERNPEGVDETGDTPSLAMDYGNEFPEAMRQRLQTNRPEDFETLSTSFEPWSSDPYGEQMASFWSYAMQTAGNGNIPNEFTEDSSVEGHSTTPGEVTQEEVDSLKTLHQSTQETLGEMYGDTVPLFRPISGDAAKELKNAKENDENDDIQFTHRPAESWSGDIEQISQRSDFQDEDTVVIRREVDTANVLASSVTGSPGLDAQDNEFVVSSGTQTEYKRDDVLTGDDMKDPQAVMEQTAWANDTTGGTEQTEANEDPGETVEEGDK